MATTDYKSVRDLCDMALDNAVSDEEFFKQSMEFFAPKKPRGRFRRSVANKKWDEVRPFTKTRRGTGSY
jgi:hypothetical protein